MGEKISFSHRLYKSPWLGIFGSLPRKYFPGFPAKFFRIFPSSFHIFRQCSPLQIKYVSFADIRIHRVIRIVQSPGVWYPAKQGWEFAHSLIAHLIIRSFPSNQMSDCERFPQIAQDKWATVSELLRSLKTNERMWANRSGHSWQMSNCELFAPVAHDKWANEQLL